MLRQHKSWPPPKPHRAVAGRGRQWCFSSQCWTAARTCASISRAAASPSRASTADAIARCSETSAPCHSRGRRAAREQPAADLDQPQRVEDADVLGVAGRAGEHEMELARGVVGGEAGAGLLLAGDRARELSQVPVRAALGGQARDARLEDQPHLQPPQHGVEAELGGPEPAVGVRVHEALGAQAPQRLAHGRPGDPETLGELDLPEPRARRDVTVEDEPADALVGEINDAVDLKHERHSNAYIIRSATLDRRSQGMDTLCAMPAAETQRRVRVEHGGEPVWGHLDGAEIALSRRRADRGGECALPGARDAVARSSPST